jgi:hypothetical protein
MMKRRDRRLDGYKVSAGLAEIDEAAYREQRSDKEARLDTGHEAE